MLPNLFVIGAAKSGTTAFHYYLSLHPAIHMSVDKEPNYFSDEIERASPAGAEQRLARYERLFDSPLDVRGESSVRYSFHPYPSGVPAAIHARVPEARFIYMVRDPVKRTLSHYRHRVALNTEHRTLEEVIREPNDAEERYLCASMYAMQLEQYRRFFPAERFHVVAHEDFVRDPRSVLRSAFDFLGVDPSFDSPHFGVRLNVGSENRQFSTVGDRLRRHPLYMGTLGWMRPDLRFKLVRPIRNLVSRPVAPPPATEAIERHLADTFAPDARRLRELTGHDFPDWSV
jgi:sulfotransferase family protein